MTNVAELTQVATRFRQMIESADPSKLTEDFERFPFRSGVDASILLSKMMDESGVTPEEMRRWADEKAAETGKSMNDIVIEIIRSGELDDARMAECMEMVEGPSDLIV